MIIVFFFYAIIFLNGFSTLSKFLLIFILKYSNEKLIKVLYI